MILAGGFLHNKIRPQFKPSASKCVYLGTYTGFPLEGFLHFVVARARTDTGSDRQRCSFERCRGVLGHLAVERGFLNPVEAPVDEKKSVPVYEFELEMSPVAVHLAIERQLIRN